MHQLSKLALLVTALLGIGVRAQAQVILIGCTATDQANPFPSSLVDINPMTGAASNPRSTGIFYLGGIAVQPTTNTIFGLTTAPSNAPSNSLVRIDPQNGMATLVGATGLLNIAEGDLAFNPVDGLLYGIVDGGPTVTQRNLFRINTLTGMATVIGSMSTQGDYSALAFDPSGTLFTINTGGTGNSLLHTVDPNSANLTSTTLLSHNLDIAAGMVFDPLSGSAFVSDGGTGGNHFLYALDTTTGNLTSIGLLGISDGIAGLAIPVPEPNSVSLASLIVALLAGRWRVIGFRLKFLSNRNMDKIP